MTQQSKRYRFINKNGKREIIMKKRNVITAVLLSAILLSSSMVACSPKKISAEPPVSSAPSSSPSSLEEVKEAPKNALTGEELLTEEAEFYRPVAVMINNIKPALPQRGISKADVIYEMPVEGGVTRLMALYSDYKNLPEIGSVRSSRHDYIELVKPLDALYIHIGYSDFAKTAIEKENIKSLNGLQYASTAFYKDEKRAQTRSSEHCWFTTAELAAKGIEKLQVDMTVDAPVSLFEFAKPNEDVSPDLLTPTDANEVSLTSSPGVKVSFTYDAALKKYSKTQYGEAHIDETTGEPISVKNIFLMYTDVSMMADNYHREVDLSKGTGYYISNGKAAPVTFKKTDVSSLIEVFDSSGEALKVNAGNSYFGIIPNGEEKNLTFTP